MALALRTRRQALVSDAVALSPSRVGQWGDVFAEWPHALRNRAIPHSGVFLIRKLFPLPIEAKPADIKGIPDRPIQNDAGFVVGLERIARRSRSTANRTAARFSFDVAPLGRSQRTAARRLPGPWSVSMSTVSSTGTLQNLSSVGSTSANSASSTPSNGAGNGSLIHVVGGADQRNQLPKPDYGPGDKPTAAGHRSAKRYLDVPSEQTGYQTLEANLAPSRRRIQSLALPSTFQNFQVQLSDPTQLNVTAGSNAAPWLLSVSGAATGIEPNRPVARIRQCHLADDRNGHADDFGRRRARIAHVVERAERQRGSTSWVDPNYRCGRPYDDGRSVERVHRQRRHQRHQQQWRLAGRRLDLGRAPRHNRPVGRLGDAERRQRQRRPDRD